MALRMNWLDVLSFLFCHIVFATNKNGKSVEFQDEQIMIGQKKISVEIAKTPEQHQYGLMNRNSLATDHGMLFIFDTEQTLSFWMKNTYIDLAIAYIDKNKKIVDIQEMKATNQMMVGEPPSYPSKKPAQYALEMSAGWFSKNKVTKGQKFRFISK